MYSFRLAKETLSVETLRRNFVQKEQIRTNTLFLEDTQSTCLFSNSLSCCPQLDFKLHFCKGRVPWIGFMASMERRIKYSNQ